MREITKIMIKKYALMRLKYDFMGYVFEEPEELSFHHLIIPRRECKAKGLGEGYQEWNGALIVQDTGHNYLHTVEKYDYDRFLAITSEMIDENMMGHLDMNCIKAIDDILQSFEREYADARTKKGTRLIKPEYVDCRVLRRQK